MTDEPKKLLPYVRQSSGKFDEDVDSSLSLNQQEDSLKEWGQRHGYQVLPAIRDWDESGRTMNRPGFEALKASIKPGMTVGVFKYDRFARNLIGQEQAVAALEDAGATVISITDPPGKLPRQIMGSIAEYYSDQLSERLIAIRQASVKAGRFVGVVPPYGYQRRDVVTIPDPRTGGTRQRRTGPIVVVPEDAAIVVELFERVRDGAAMHPLTRELQARGILTPAGSPITATWLRRLLRNPFYRGVVSYKGREVGPGIHEPIVSETLWRAVQDRLDHNPRTRKKKAEHIRSFAEGYVQHACGARMYHAIYAHRLANGELSRYPVFACRRANGLDKCGISKMVVVAHKVETAIRACLIADLAGLRSLEHAIATTERAAGGVDAGKARAFLAKQRAKADERLSRARELWLNGDDDLDAWEREKAQHKEAVKVIERESAALPVAPDPARFRAAAETLSGVADLIAVMDQDALRGLLAVVGVLVVSPSGMSISYRPIIRDFLGEPVSIGFGT